jgi:hypothetical protein
VPEVVVGGALDDCEDVLIIFPSEAQASVVEPIEEAA